MTTTILILGAAGDVTERWLLPGLGGLLASGRGDELRLVGSDRLDWQDAQWRHVIADAFASMSVTGPLLDSVVRDARYVRADVTDAEDLRRLLDIRQGALVIYFALPPMVTMRACSKLVEIGVPADTQLVMEKPFGTDSRSAQELNELLARLVPEDQIHRLDHFLGMTTVINIVGLRFTNPIIEAVLNAEHVASVDIVFDENLGLEGRGGYYDHAGALVDMLQNHLLQVLSLVAMEAPASLRAADMRERKAQVLEVTKVWQDDPVAFSRRGRYTAGELNGRRLPAYVDEPGVDPGRNTETFAELVLQIDSPRWAGVPFRLRSGKAIGTPRQEVAITFRRPAEVPSGLRGNGQPDRLRIGLGPHQIALDLNINGPGDPYVIDPLTLEATFATGDLPPYGEILRGILHREPPLSVRGDTAVRCWQIVEPALAAWRAGRVPLLEYPAGSAGPPGWPQSGPPDRMRAA